jgi:hypothetical protein
MTKTKKAEAEVTGWVQVIETVARWWTRRDGA